METDRDDVELDQIRAARRAAMEQVAGIGNADSVSDDDVISGASGSSAGGARDGGGHPSLPSSGNMCSETERVAGKNAETSIPGGSGTDPVRSPESKNSPSTHQLWVRLPEDFAALLRRQPASHRGYMFMAVVFGQMGTTYAPSEFFAAVEHLQRISMLLQCALQRGFPETLVTAVRHVVKLINQLCRNHVGYVRMRVRLPNEYADALLSLSPGDRERMIRLAVRAGAASISLQQVVLKASVLHRLRMRLLMKLDSVSSASPEAHVRELLDVISSLRSTLQKGALP